MKTRDFFHNQRMEPMKFFAKKWAKKKVVGRQITFDAKNCIDSYFVVDPKTYELFIYFEAFSTKTNPRIIKIGKLDDKYPHTVKILCIAEVAILNMVSSMSFEALKSITTTEQMESAMKAHIK